MTPGAGFWWGPLLNCQLVYLYVATPCGLSTGTSLGFLTAWWWLCLRADMPRQSGRHAWHSYGLALKVRLHHFCYTDGLNRCKAPPRFKEQRHRLHTTEWEECGRGDIVASLLSYSLNSILKLSCAFYYCLFFRKGKPCVDLLWKASVSWIK